MPEEYPPEQGRSLMSEILVICSIGGDGDGDDIIIDRSINTNVRVFLPILVGPGDQKWTLLHVMSYARKAPVTTRVYVSDKIITGTQLHLYCLNVVHPNTS